MLGRKMKTVRVNGEARQTEIDSLDSLVRAQQQDTSGLVLEYNGRIVREQEWAATMLNDGDVIEMLLFVGGG